MMVAELLAAYASSGLYNFVAFAGAPPTVANAIPLPVLQLWDYSCVGPQGQIGDITWQPITGIRVVLEQVLRAWMSPRGSLFWAPHRGVDFRDLENSTPTAADLARWRGALIQEAAAVAYVLPSVRVLIQQPDSRSLLITSRIPIDSGTLRFYPLGVQLSSAGIVATNLAGLSP